MAPEGKAAPEPGTSGASTSSNVRRSLRKRAEKNVNPISYEQYTHKWTKADKTTMLQALKEFGPADLDNISLKLPNKHPNQIKVFISNMKSKAKVVMEYRLQSCLRVKMSNLKKVIEFIEQVDDKQTLEKPDWYNPALLMALAVIKNMEEHPKPAQIGGDDYKIDYMEAYGYLIHILDYRGGNINTQNQAKDAEKTENMNFSDNTKNFVLQTIYAVLKSAILHSCELNAIISSQEHEKQSRMYDEDQLEDRLKSYLSNNLHNPLSFSCETLSALPNL